MHGYRCFSRAGWTLPRVRAIAARPGYASLAWVAQHSQEPAEAGGSRVAPAWAAAKRVKGKALRSVDRGNTEAGLKLQGAT